MNTESGKTMMYVAVAAILAVAGAALSPSGPKSTQDGMETLIGTEFYKNFTNPAEATSIEVIGYDAATATATPFSVDFKDGLWRIPTRYNYPADAKDRLAKVAASIIGLKRDALAGRTESEQAEFQVLDPREGKPENLKGIGNRLTLRNGNTVLADYIIGKQVPGKTGYYYVRKPDEKQTFIAKVELNLSTKFTDWIEPDVLNLEGAHLTHINILKHTLEIERSGPKLVGEEQNVLTRANSSDPWKLEELDDATEEVNQDEVRKLVTSLDELKIVGVKPKPESLRKDLRSDEGIKLDQETADDLSDRGFYILRAPRGGVQMVSKEGDLVAGTDQGVEYEMHFGSVFEGSDEDIELGFVKKSAGEGDRPADAENKDDAKPEDKGGPKKKSRFIFVTARVNPALFGPAPEEPVKPEPPSDEKPAEEKTPAAKPDGDGKKDEQKSDESKSDEKTEGDPTKDAAAADKSVDEKPTDEKPAEEAKPDAESPKPDPKAAYEEALKKYDVDLKQFEADVKSRDAKLKEADEKVKALNDRFADWYYVISAESFENLRQGRATLVKAKPDAEKKPGSEDEAGTPDDKPKDGESEESAPETLDKPAADQPKDETPKSDTPEK